MSDDKDNVISLFRYKKKTKDNTSQSVESLSDRLDRIKHSISCLNVLMEDLKTNPSATSHKETKKTSIENDPKILNTFKKREEDLKKIKKENNERVKKSYKL